MVEIQSIPKRNILIQIFISPDEPRLRAGWRLLSQTLMMLFIAIIITAVLKPILGEPQGRNIDFLIGQLIYIVMMTGSVYVACRSLDKRPFASLGLQIGKQSWFDILVGLGITFVLMGLIYIVEMLSGWLTFENFAWQLDPAGTLVSSVLIFLISFVIVGWNEELLSRGYHLQTIASGTNLLWGLLISSSIFGVAHLGSPNATWLGAAGIFFVGLFFAYGFLRTGQLWLSIGLHIGWNFFQSVIFGFPVSGLNIYRLVQTDIHGPELWTGGAFGPEAGLIVLPALIIGAVLIYFYTKDRKRAQNP
jgi:membrane protease YdiL (CAAX protease family)